ncbi:MAG: diguanylate cyclase [Betaproteobacteria bacterium]|nr:diguanylate cyclase [Betaproteobacteria bacterium]
MTSNAPTISTGIRPATRYFGSWPSVANASIRSSDALFRWGGEEFAVLASSTGYRGAGRLAETIRGRVAQHSFPGVGRITASLGVA